MQRWKSHTPSIFRAPDSADSAAVSPGRSSGWSLREEVGGTHVSCRGPQDSIDALGKKQRAVD